MSTVGSTCIACDAALAPAAWVRLPYWALHRCSACGSLTALPRPSDSDQQDLHSEAAYFEHPYFESRRHRDLVEQRCREIFERIYGVAVPPDLRHLDVGCDTGEFLLAAHRLFATVPHGVEIAPTAAQTAREQGLDVHVAPLESLPQNAGQFDLITAIDLVEHLSDPKGFFDEAAKRLKKSSGLLFIETPNPQSVVYRLVRLLTNATSGRPRWIAERVFLREHIQYFTRTGLLSLAESAGLTPLKVAERHLDGRDISASTPVRAAMSGLQELDRPPLGAGILLWAVFATRQLQ